MRIVRAVDVTEMAGQIPAVGTGLQPHWLEGPFAAGRLDVGMVTMGPGRATPAHVHVGGQVIVVVAGRGFVEVDGARHALEEGDVIICPPGEEHIHGAVDDQPLAHLTVTTGGYRFPGQPETPDDTTET